MKLGEAIPKYQAYRNQLQDKKKDIYKQLKNARDKAERTGNDEWTQKAAQLQLSYDKASERILTNMRMHLTDLESSGVRLLMQRMPRHSQIRRRDLGQQ